MRKEEILPFVATWMKLEGIVLSEISQTQKDKVSLTQRILKKKESNPQTQSRKVVAGGNKERLVKRHKLLALR